MNRMKLFALLLALVLLLLAGCSAANTAPETTVATEPTVMEETTAPTELPLPDVQRFYGMDYYRVKGGYYPTALGAPELTEEEATKYFGNKLDDSKDLINTVGDAYYYLNKITNETQPFPLCMKLAALITGDYDDIGLIEYQMEKQYYCLVYVKQDGMYYALDPFYFGMRPDGRRGKNWLNNAENGCADEDLQTLAERMYEILPDKGLSLISIDISGDPSKPHGSPLISPSGASYPVAFGYPQLTNKEVEALIAEGDYEKIAKTINTLGDAINFCLRSKMDYDPSQNMNFKGKLSYAQSAWQVLKSNQGQCVSMSNLFHYLLKDDYDEVGYVNVRAPSSGHVMIYILHDGMYYLVNPLDYTQMYYGYTQSWFGYYSGLLVCCAEDFQTIADSLVTNMRLDQNELVNHVHLIKSPGDCVRGDGKYYPIGCEVIPYYGEQDITYIEAGYEWDTQTRIDY